MGVLILGAGGHARVVVDAALSSGVEILGIIDFEYQGQKENILGINVLGGIDVLDKYNPKKISVAIAIGDNREREKWYLKLKKQGIEVATIIHPTAISSKKIVVGEGVFINSGAIINAEVSIGDNCIINTGVIIEHECSIKSHSHLAPGVRMGGRGVVEQGSFVGIGSSIIQGITIGSGATIGAGSVIIRDVNPKTVVVGVPGREVN